MWSPVFGTEVNKSHDGKEPAYDGVFFQEGEAFNQGNIYKFNRDAVIEKMEFAETLAKTPNAEGPKLKKRFSYKKTLEALLSKLTV